MTDAERNESEREKWERFAALSDSRVHAVCMSSAALDSGVGLAEYRRIVPTEVRDRTLAVLDSRDQRIAELEGEASHTMMVGVTAYLRERDALREQLATPIPHVTPADFAALESVFDELKSMDQAAERDAIRAQLAAAQADTERLDWLEDFARKSSDGLLLHALRNTNRTGLGIEFRTLAKAIDSARATKESKDAE